MQLPYTLKRYQQQITAPGSPLRLLRKAALYAAHPRESLHRLSAKNGVLRDLPEPVREAADNMRRNGFAWAGGILDPQLVSELGEEIGRRMEGHRVGVDQVTERKFWSRVSSADDLRPDSLLVRFAMQENVVKTATAYMGMVPCLSNVQVIVSFGTDAEGWQDSQLWHQDYQDTRSLNVWVYLTDVLEPKHGPFTYLPAEPSRRVPNTFFPGRVTDEQMQASGLMGEVHAVTGPRLTPFLIDTARCYHMGSRVQLGEVRVAYVATFYTPASLWPSHGIAVEPDAELTSLERMLLVRHR